MSKATKRKHVAKEVLEDYFLPSEQQTIVRVLEGRGNNLHEVEDPNGAKYLVSMPTKFRRSIWIKRGDFIIVEPIAEGGKVKAEVSHILMKDQIRYIKNQGKWPEAFAKIDEQSQNQSEEALKNEQTQSDDECSSDSSGDDLVMNPNRFIGETSDFESDEGSSDDEEET
uniref:Probable RNA-binding protein EIF1AD n=1 Tax=Lynceus sp. MCZ IZ 141354 TaxID=1930659 RepID=A0A9N6WZL0_9CRUS|nr:EOG090X0KPP [Lynceus sp. MCZ IZ 141354]